jgi:hypothetical protein
VLLTGPAKPKGTARRPPSRKKMSVEIEELKLDVDVAPVANRPALPIPQKKVAPRAPPPGAGGLTHGVKLEDLAVLKNKKPVGGVVGAKKNGGGGPVVVPPKKKRVMKYIRVQYFDTAPVLVETEVGAVNGLEASLESSGLEQPGRLFVLLVEGPSELQDAWEPGAKLCCPGDDGSSIEPHARAGPPGGGKKRVAEVEVEGYDEKARILVTSDDTGISLLSKVLRKLRIPDNSPAVLVGLLPHEGVWDVPVLHARMMATEGVATALSLFSGERFEIELARPGDSAASVLAELLELDGQTARKDNAILFLLIPSLHQSDILLHPSDSVLCMAAWFDDVSIFLAFGPSPVQVAPLDDPF